MNKSTYEEIERYMLGCMGDSAHDRQHIYRVLYHALDIAGREAGVDHDVLIASCLLHDIGREEEFSDPALCHARVGGEKAYGWLAVHGWEEGRVSHVRDCIASHRYRGENPPATIEAKILYDADKLDAAGALGIARTLLYQGRESHPLYSLGADGTVSEGGPGEGPSFLQEYRCKLEKLYDRFYTERASQLARERRAAAESFHSSIRTEVEGCHVWGPALLGRRLAGE